MRGGEKGKRWFERHPRLTLVFLVTVTVVLADLAIGLVVIPDADYNFRTAHPYYHHGMLPGREGLSRWGSGRTYPVFTNSLGMLDGSPRDVPLTTPKRRVVIIGDSFGEGIGFPFEKTFAGILNRAVDRTGMEILNASALSYSPRLYYLKTKYLVEKVGLRFDELWVFLDISDVQDEVHYRTFDPAAEEPRRSFAQKAAGRLRGVSAFVYTVTLYGERKRRAKLRERYEVKYHAPWLDYFWLDNRDTTPFSDPEFIHIREKWTAEEYSDSEWTRLGVRLALENMGRLLELCRDHGIKLSVAVYPWPFQIRNRDLESRQVRVWRAFCEENNVAFINLFPAFMEHPRLDIAQVLSRLFVDGDVHWNPAGHALVAEKVLEYLEE